MSSVARMEACLVRMPLVLVSVPEMIEPAMATLAIRPLELTIRPEESMLLVVPLMLPPVRLPPIFTGPR